MGILHSGVCIHCLARKTKKSVKSERMPISDYAMIAMEILPGYGAAFGSRVIVHEEPRSAAYDPGNALQMWSERIPGYGTELIAPAVHAAPIKSLTFIQVASDTARAAWKGDNSEAFLVRITTDGIKPGYANRETRYSGIVNATTFEISDLRAGNQYYIEVDRKDGGSAYEKLTLEKSQPERIKVWSYRMANDLTVMWEGSDIFSGYIAALNGKELRTDTTSLCFRGCGDKSCSITVKGQSYDGSLSETAAFDVLAISKSNATVSFAVAGDEVRLRLAEGPADSPYAWRIRAASEIVASGTGKFAKHTSVLKNQGGLLEVVASGLNGWPGSVHKFDIGEWTGTVEVDRTFVVASTRDSIEIGWEPPQGNHWGYYVSIEVPGDENAGRHAYVDKSQRTYSFSGLPPGERFMACVQIVRESRSGTRSPGTYVAVETDSADREELSVENLRVSNLPSVTGFFAMEVTWDTKAGVSHFVKVCNATSLLPVFATEVRSDQCRIGIETPVFRRGKTYIIAVVPKNKNGSLGREAIAHASACEESNELTLTAVACTDSAMAVSLQWARLTRGKIDGWLLYVLSEDNGGWGVSFQSPLIPATENHFQTTFPIDARQYCAVLVPVDDGILGNPAYVPLPTAETPLPFVRLARVDYRENYARTMFSWEKGDNLNLKTLLSREGKVVGEHELGAHALSDVWSLDTKFHHKWTAYAEGREVASVDVDLTRGWRGKVDAADVVPYGKRILWRIHWENECPPQPSGIPEGNSFCVRVASDEPEDLPMTLTPARTIHECPSGHGIDGSFTGSVDLGGTEGNLSLELTVSYPGMAEVCCAQIDVIIDRDGEVQLPTAPMAVKCL